jgi:hypothetical protein
MRKTAAAALGDADVWEIGPTSELPACGLCACARTHMACLRMSGCKRPVTN